MPSRGAIGVAAFKQRVRPAESVRYFRPSSLFGAGVRPGARCAVTQQADPARGRSSANIRPRHLTSKSRKFRRAPKDRPCWAGPASADRRARGAGAASSMLSGRLRRGLICLGAARQRRRCHGAWSGIDLSLLGAPAEKKIRSRPDPLRRRRRASSERLAPSLVQRQPRGPAPHGFFALRGRSSDEPGHVAALEIWWQRGRQERYVWRSCRRFTHAQNSKPSVGADRCPYSVVRHRVLADGSSSSTTRQLPPEHPIDHAARVCWAKAAQDDAGRLNTARFSA